jgi:hypothetical protein
MNLQYYSTMGMFDWGWTSRTSRSVGTRPSKNVWLGLGTLFPDGVDRGAIGRVPIRLLVEKAGSCVPSTVACTTLYAYFELLLYFPWTIEQRW